jgi:hypothetical protein
MLLSRHRHTLSVTGLLCPEGYWVVIFDGDWLPIFLGPSFPSPVGISVSFTNSGCFVSVFPDFLLPYYSFLSSRNFRIGSDQDSNTGPGTVFFPGFPLSNASEFRRCPLLFFGTLLGVPVPSVQGMSYKSGGYTPFWVTHTNHCCIGSPPLSPDSSPNGPLLLP